MGRWEIHLVNVLLAATLFLFSLWAYQQLPDSVPVHFNLDGSPTRWAATSFWSWFIGPIIGFGLIALNYGIAAAAPRFPDHVNIPDKKKYQELPLERKLRVLAVTQNLLYVLSTPLLILFLLIQYGSWITSQGGSATPYMVTALILAILMTPGIMIFFLPKVQRVLKRELLEFEEEKLRSATQKSGH